MSFSAEKSLAYTEQDEVLSLHQDGEVAVNRIVETGEFRDELFKVGDQTMSFRMPVSKLQQSETFASLEDFATTREDLRAHYQTVRYLQESEINNADYSTWKDNLTLFDVEALAGAAREMRANEVDYNIETVICANCKGEQMFTVPCWCTHGGDSITDLESGESVTERQSGEPDPECVKCLGHGETTNPCPVCDGSGVRQKFPKLSFVTPGSNERQYIVLDVADIIANFPELIKRETVLYDSYGTVSAHISMVFALSQLVERQLEELGVNKDDALFYAESGSNGKLETYFQDVRFAKAEWNNKYGNIQALRRSRSGSKEPVQELSAHDYIAQLQQTMAGRFGGNNAPAYTQDDGTRQFEVRSIESFENSLTGLRRALGARGLTLAFAYEGIATGEVGPAFMAINGNLDVEAKLSLDYDTRISLENAWARFIEIEHLLGQ